MRHDGLLAEIFRGFPQFKANAIKSVHSPRVISLSHLSLATEATDVTLGASGLWLGIRTGDGGTVILT